MGMGLFFQSRERERYYLLPGMGKRALRRKRRLMLGWGLGVGLLLSAALAAVLFWLHQR